MNEACLKVMMEKAFTVADPDLQLKEGRFSLTCPASFSSFYDFFSFTQNEERLSPSGPPLDPPLSLNWFN